MMIFPLSDDRNDIVRQCREDDLPAVSKPNFALLEGRLSIERFSETVKAALYSKHYTIAA